MNEIKFNWLTDIYEHVQQLSNWVGELQLKTQKQDHHIQWLENHIQGLEYYIQEKDLQLHKQDNEIKGLKIIFKDRKKE